jgi:hypothetical protein
MAGAREFVRLTALVYHITGLCTACRGFLFQTRQLLFSGRTVTSLDTTVASFRDLLPHLLDSHLRLLRLRSAISEYLAYSVAGRSGTHPTQHILQHSADKRIPRTYLPQHYFDMSARGPTPDSPRHAALYGTDDEYDASELFDFDRYDPASPVGRSGQTTRVISTFITATCRVTSHIGTITCSAIHDHTWRTSASWKPCGKRTSS